MTRDLKKTKRRKLERWKILLLALILWVGFAFAKSAWENHRLRRELASLEKRLVVLELRGAELQREIEEWQSPEFVEQVAREELGLVKPGEVVYVLSEPLNGSVQGDAKKR